MPSFDLKGIKVATYTNNNGTIAYSGATSLGDAMNVNLQLNFAEGRLYAESTLAEYMKKAIGGTISIATKYIPKSAQLMLFGNREKTRTFTCGTASVTASSIQTGGNDVPKDVGVAFYAPDKVDGATKYACVFITRALFGQPSYVYQTASDNITFNTPTITGEFLADHSANREMIEIGVCDTEEQAKAWVDSVLGAV